MVDFHFTKFRLFKIQISEINSSFFIMTSLRKQLFQHSESQREKLKQFREQERVNQVISLLELECQKVLASDYIRDELRLFLKDCTLNEEDVLSSSGFTPLYQAIINWGNTNHIHVHLLWDHFCGHKHATCGSNGQKLNSECEPVMLVLDWRQKM